ncbi:MAG TPA: ABC transporter permease, partial [Gemmatimonadaceae bacterium]|nr:ABC transporter permease [Gemmatimonadaceae bacterium]
MNPFDGIKRVFRLGPTRRAGGAAGGAGGDVDDELRFHLEMRAAELRRQGAGAEEAERQAAREFGDLREARRELAAMTRRRAEREERSDFLAGLWQDARYAVRSLLARPGFTAAVVATIALGVGANAAIYSVVDAALLRPLPFAGPERLVHLWERPATDAGPGSGPRYETSYPDFLDIRRRATTLAGVAGYHGGRVTLAAGDRATVLSAAKVTANFFDVLGVRPLAGRTFAAGEDEVGAPKVVMLTHGVWRRLFGGDRGIVGRVVQLDGQPYTVAGVLPERFHFAAVGSADVWVPIDRPPSMRERRSSHWLKAVARLRDGATVDAARRELAAIAGELAREFPQSNAGQGAEVVPLRDELVGTVRPLLLTLYGAVAFVLLVACGNVANLLLVRGAARQRELSIRAALGAGRGRIARQLLTESTLLALCGGALGIVVAHAGIRALVAAIPPEQARALPYLRDVGLDAGVLGYAVLVSLVAGTLSGLVPALRASRTELQAALRQSTGGGASAAGSQRLLRDGLVVAELALTVVLVSGAALFARSLTSLLAVDVGFRGEGVLTMMVPLPRWSYATERAQRQFYQSLEARVSALPGVRSVGLVSKLPLDYGNSTSYSVPGAPPPTPGQEPSASYRVVSPRYFETLGIPLLGGRTFTATEDSAAGGVVVINRALAREGFGDRDPVGREITVGGRPMTVVGVVGDVTIGKLEDEIPPTMYFSILQAMDLAMRLAVRAERGTDPHALAVPIRAALRDLDPSVATFQVYTMDELVGQSQSVFLRRYPLVLVGAFAAIALVLALVGTYGVISYAVTQRLRELGIRIALGARPESIRWLVLRHAGALASLGITLGVIGAAALSRLA